MELKEAIEILKDNDNVNEILENCGCKVMSAIDTVLSELDRLRNKLKDKIIEYKNNSGCKYCNNTCEYYGKCMLLQELLHEEVE